MTVEDKIKYEKLQYNIKIEAAKIPALSSRKVDEFDYLTGEEILLSDQRRMTKEAKFTYSPLGKAFEKQIETTENQGEKKIKATEEHGKPLVKYNNEKESITYSNQKRNFWHSC